MKTNHHFNRFAVFAAAIIAAFAFAGCPQLTDSGSSFVAVTGITGVPAGGKIGQELDLTKAAVEPYNATNQTIVWGVKNAGETGITTADLADAKATPAAAGRLVVTAVIANGTASGNYTRDFEIDIREAFVAVTDITGVPGGGNVGSVLDLSGAGVEPSDATYYAIVWTVKNAGTTGITTADLEYGQVTPAATGTLVLTAAIANGKGQDINYEEDFTIIINEEGFVQVENISGVPPSVIKGTELDLTGARVTPANAANRTIEWTVKDAGGTGVTEIVNGKAAPAAAGTLTVTATIANGKGRDINYEEDFTITVTASFVAVTGITGVPTGGIVGTAIDLTKAAVTPGDATNSTIVWSVKSAGETGVTTADLEDGKATPTGAGTLVLTATIANGKAAGQNYTQDFSITVTQPGTFVPVTGITYTAPSLLYNKQTLDLTTAEVVPSTATNSTIVWSVKDPGATGVTTIFDDGTVVPPKAGTLVLTATVVNGTASGDYTREFTITVTQFVPVTRINYSPYGNLLLGTEIDLTTATVVPANATNRTIVWSVNDAGTTGVTNADLEDGKVTPSAKGSLHLLATVKNGNSLEKDYTYSFNFNIVYTEVTGITNIPSVIALGMELDLTGVKILPENKATTAGIVWTVTDDGGTGVSTADLADGRATPAAGGSLLLKATVADGLAPGTPYVKDNIEIYINDENTVFLYKNGGLTALDTFELLDQALAYIDENAVGNADPALADKYLIELRGNQNMTAYTSPADTGKANIEITLRGHGAERTILGPGDFTLNNNMTLILDNNITLNNIRIIVDQANLRIKEGSKVTGVSRSGNNTTAIHAGTPDVMAGSVTLEGGEISGNHTTYAVYVGQTQTANYTFTMSSGAIKDNDGYGLVVTLGTVTMSGGTISDNTNGVYILLGGSSFTMSGGTISGNTNGVNINANTGFTMTGGTITGNTKGVFTSGDFTMTGGTITGNERGVQLDTTAKFIIASANVTIGDRIGIMGYNGNNGRILLGSSFTPSAPIAIDLAASSETNFNKQWRAAARSILQNTPENGSGDIGAAQNNFTLGNGYRNSSFTTLKTGGSLGWVSGSPGYVQWTDNP